MKKFILPLFVFLITSLFFGCVPKEDYEKLKEDYEKLIKQNSQLEDEYRILFLENSKLKEELKELKQTDSYLYQVAADYVSAENFSEAKSTIEDFKNKFPQSPLLKDIKTLSSRIEKREAEIYQQELNLQKEVLKKAKNARTEEAINILRNYINGSHPNDLVLSAKEKLDFYEKKYQEEFASIQLENEIGFRLANYSTGWEWYADFTRNVFCPRINIKWQVTGTVKKYTKLKAVFRDINSNEIFGTSSHYFDDTQLYKEGDVISTNIICSRGFIGFLNNDFADLPNLKVELYFEITRDYKESTNFYKTYTIKKGYLK